MWLAVVITRTPANGPFSVSFQRYTAACHEHEGFSGASHPRLGNPPWSGLRLQCTRCSLAIGTELTIINANLCTAGHPVHALWHKVGHTESEAYPDRSETARLAWTAHACSSSTYLHSHQCKHIAEIEVSPMAAEAPQPAAGMLPTAPLASAGARAVTGSVSVRLLARRRFRMACAALSLWQTCTAQCAFSSAHLLCSQDHEPHNCPCRWCRNPYNGDPRAFSSDSKFAVAPQL